MREYEVEVVEKKIVYVEAENEKEAKRLAETEAIHEEPDEISCKIISSIDLDEEQVNICGERGCDGCIFQHRGDIELCKQEAARKNN